MYSSLLHISEVAERTQELNKILLWKHPQLDGRVLDEVKYAN
jgi:hypothetical protein